MSAAITACGPTYSQLNMSIPSCHVYVAAKKKENKKAKKESRSVVDTMSKF